MPEFLAPAGLWALLAVPLIWWLHRFRDRGLRYPVSTMLLWRDVSGAEAAGVRLTTADAAWWRRAAVAALSALAIAQPVWNTGGPRLTVWVDESLSMWALENGERRIDAARRRLTEKMGRRTGALSRPSEIVIRSLGEAGKAVAIEHPGDLDSALTEWFREPGDEPVPPPPGLLDPGREHWLVTDGADPGLAEWAKRAQLAGVIRVGIADQNSAVSGLSARPSLRGDGTLLAQVDLAHFGTRDREVQLEISADGSPLLSRTVTMPRNETVTHGFELPARHGTLTARLQPLADDRTIAATGVSPDSGSGAPDALPLDDSLTLDLAALAPVPVVMEGACGANLTAALGAHPALGLTDRQALSATARTPSGDPPGLLVVCEPRTGDGSTTASVARRGSDVSRTTDDWPRIHIRSSGETERIPGSARWAQSAGPMARLSLPARSLVFRPLNQDRAREPVAWQPLLTADDRILIQAREGVVEVGLDMEDPDLAALPVYPLLVAALAEHALDRTLTAAIASTRRPARASRIAPDFPPLPGPGADRSTSGSDAGARFRMDLAVYFLLAALALLMLDTTRLWRDWRLGERTSGSRAGSAPGTIRTRGSSVSSGSAKSPGEPGDEAV